MLLEGSFLWLGRRVCQIYIYNRYTHSAKLSHNFNTLFQEYEILWTQLVSDFQISPLLFVEGLHVVPECLGGEVVYLYRLCLALLLAEKAVCMLSVKIITKVLPHKRFGSLGHNTFGIFGRASHDFRQFGSICPYCLNIRI